MIPSTALIDRCSRETDKGKKCKDSKFVETIGCQEYCKRAGIPKVTSLLRIPGLAIPALPPKPSASSSSSSSASSSSSSSTTPITPPPPSLQHLMHGTLTPKKAPVLQAMRDLRKLRSQEFAMTQPALFFEPKSKQLHISKPPVVVPEYDKCVRQSLVE